MRAYEGRVSEMIWQPEAGRSARLTCPPNAIPAPGRYLLAWSSEDPDAPLAAPLFAALLLADGFIAAPPIPPAWEPGTRLELRGPMGRGFEPPAGLRRLGLAALGPGLARLGPLMDAALEQGAEVALFTDAALPAGPHSLPSAVEVNPLAALPEALTWADFLALEIPLERLAELPSVLGLAPGARDLPCLAQALVITAMPCAGVGACGACSLETRRGWKLACEDGPVFPVAELLNR